LLCIFSLVKVRKADREARDAAKAAVPAPAEAAGDATPLEGGAAAPAPAPAPAEAEAEADEVVLVRKRGDLDKVRKAEVEARKAIDAKYKALRGDIGLLRHEPLGTDRNERSYWHLGGDLSVLFVRSPNPVAPDGWIDEGAAAAAAAKLGRTRRATQKVQLSAELTAGATWCVLHTSEEVDTVVASLRLEGRREYKLASVLADCKEAMASARASAAERAARFDPASTSMSVVAFSRATRFLQKSEQTSVVIELNETVDKLSLAERESPSALAEATGFASPPGHFDWRTQRFRAELIDIVDGASVFFYSIVCSILLFYSFVYLEVLYSFFALFFCLLAASVFRFLFTRDAPPFVAYVECFASPAPRFACARRASSSSGFSSFAGLHLRRRRVRSRAPRGVGRRRGARRELAR
jgi:hypothetical protein